MRGKHAAALTAVAAMLLFVVPTAQAQANCEHPLACPNVSTPTSLYFHIFDIFNNFPINTQVPHPGFFQVGGTNFPSLVEPNTGQNYDFNTMYGYSTSGPVEYNFIENGQPRFHPERGIANDIRIDDQAATPCGDVVVPACVHIYVSLRDATGGTSTNFMPKYTFKVEMRELNVLGDTAALDAAPMIMHGELAYHLASKDFASLNDTVPPGDTVHIRTPNADGVIEYAIPMTIEGTKITKSDGYHMHIHWFQDPSPDASHQDQAAEGYMRLVMDEKYHPRLDLSIKNPVYIDFIHPEVAAGILLIHSAENSPWGTYDIDVQNITVDVKDADGNHVDAGLQQVTSQNSHVHNLHNKSAEVTYLWRFRDENAKDGTYTITLKVQNVAHTATATDTAQFVLEGKKAYGIAQNGETVTPAPDPAGEGKSSPGAGLLVLGTAFGLALAMRRRLD